MTEISDLIKEKFELEPTDFKIGQSFLFGASIYSLSGISEKHQVLMANCDRHGITHENNMLYVFVGGIVNQLQFSKFLLESNEGMEVLLKEVNQTIENIEMLEES